MSNYNRDNMKLSKILAISGCEMRPNGEMIDVVAGDGKVVMQGNISQLREKMFNNCVAYGEPIVHPSVRPFRGEPPIVKTKRAAEVANIVQKSIEDEMERHEKAMAALSLGGAWVKKEVKEEKAKGAESAENPTKKIKSVPGEKVVDSEVALLANKMQEQLCIAAPVPFTNRVGELQERFQSRGMSPQYRILRKKGPAHNLVFTCQVTLGSLDAIAMGNSKQIAKHNAAGRMLQKLDGDKIPEVKDEDIWEHIGPGKACVDCGADDDEEDTTSEEEVEVEKKEEKKKDLAPLFCYNENYLPSGLEDGEKSADISIEGSMAEKRTSYKNYGFNDDEKPAGKRSAPWTEAVKQQASPWPNNSVLGNRAARRAHLRQVTQAQLDKWGDERVDLGREKWTE